MNNIEKFRTRQNSGSRWIRLTIGLAIIFTISLTSCTNSAAPLPSSNTPAIPTSSTQTPNMPTNPVASATLTPKYGGTLRILTDSVPAAGIGWPSEIVMGGEDPIALCLESLLRSDNKGNIIPWLAESYKVADDLQSITFKLRQGVKFHDGSDFNADVAKWNLDNQITAGMALDWSSVDVIDNYTIRLNIKSANSSGSSPPAGMTPPPAPPSGGGTPPPGFIPPTGPPPGLTSSGGWKNSIISDLADATTFGFMVSKTACDKNGVDWMRQHPTGTGAFKFESYTSGLSFTVVRNPDYWGTDEYGNKLPYLDKIEYICVSYIMTRMMSLQAGEGDVATLDVGKYAADAVSNGLTVTIGVSNPYGLYGDTANKDSPWANQKVREAVEYAIDKESITKAYGYGFSEAPYQLPGRGSAAYDPNFSLIRKYNVEKAKQLLTEAGYPNGFETDIICAPMGLNTDITVVMKAYLEKVGIKVNLEYPEMTKFIGYNIGDAWHNAALFEPSGAMPNNNDVLSSLFRNINHVSWARPDDVMAAYKAAIGTPSLDLNKTRTVFNLITEQALIIPIYESGRGFALQPYVMNAGFNERGTAGFWNAERAWLNK
jgi:peptide/nickel transport system substrate-binding protein